MKAEPVIVAGKTMAYACGKCGTIHGNGGFEAVERHGLQHHKDMADGCCLCRECGAEIGPHGLWCAACQEKQRQEREAHQPELDERWEREARELQESLTSAKDADIAELLRELMSDISEEYYCAGWLIGLEFSLWAMLQGGPRDFGMGVVKDSEIADLKRLHEKAGGWWHYKEQCLFVPTDEWVSIYAKEHNDTK